MMDKIISDLKLLIKKESSNSIFNEIVNQLRLNLENICNDVSLVNYCIRNEYFSIEIEKLGNYLCFDIANNNFEIRSDNFEYMIFYDSIKDVKLLLKLIDTMFLGNYITINHLSQKQKRISYDLLFDEESLKSYNKTNIKVRYFIGKPSIEVKSKGKCFGNGSK